MKNTHGTEEVVDFSPGSIKKAIEKKALNSPLTVYPVVAGLIAGAALLLIDVPMFLAYVAGGSMFLGAGSWVVNYFIRGETLKLQYTETLRRMLQEQVSQTVEFLKEELTELKLEQGVEQLAQLREKFESLERVLAMRFKQGELTYGRYLGTAEQVYKGAVDNLKDVAVALRSIEAIDSARLQKRLKECERHPDENNQRECATLKERLKLHSETQKRVTDLLSLNEEAMTTLDNTAVAVSKIQSGGKATMDVEDAMKELMELAKRAPQYNSSS